MKHNIHGDLEDLKAIHDDIKSVLSMLEGGTERRKIINYIQEYLIYTEKYDKTK